MDKKLELLIELFENGTLTEEEFLKKRKELQSKTEEEK